MCIVIIHPHPHDSLVELLVFSLLSFYAPFLLFCSPTETVLTGYVRSSERYAFYDALGNVEDARLAPLIPEGEVRYEVAILTP